MARGGIGFLSIKVSGTPADISIQNGKGAPVLVYAHPNGSGRTFRHLTVVERYKTVAPSHLGVHASERLYARLSVFVIVQCLAVLAPPDFLRKTLMRIRAMAVIMKPITMNVMISFMLLPKKLEKVSGSELAFPLS